MCVCVGHTHCRLVIKCKAVTKEWMSFKPLGSECGDKTFQGKNTHRRTHTHRLKCHVYTWRWASFRKQQTSLAQWRPRRRWHFALSFPSIKAVPSRQNTTEISGAITNIASYCIRCQSHPTKAAVPHIQTAPLHVCVYVYFLANGANSVAFGIQ